MHRQNLRRITVIAAVPLLAMLTLACLFLPRGLALTAMSDLASGALMLIALIVFASLGFGSKGRLRWFWMLQAVGWGLWLSD